MWPWDTAADQRTPAGELDYPSLGYVYDFVSIRSVQFPQADLRVDGRAVTQFAGPGAGIVNCQFGVGPWEKFSHRTAGRRHGCNRFGPVPKCVSAHGRQRRHPVRGARRWNRQLPVRHRPLGKIPAGATRQWGGRHRLGPVPESAYLRVDGSSVTQFADLGAGIVNCQFGVGPYESFASHRVCRAHSGEAKLAGPDKRSLRALPFGSGCRCGRKAPLSASKKKPPARERAEAVKVGGVYQCRCNAGRAE